MSALCIWMKALKKKKKKKKALVEMMYSDHHMAENSQLVSD